MPTTSRMSPVVRFVRGLEGDYLMLSEVARLLGVSENTLQTWRKRPDGAGFQPSEVRYFGNRPVLLYTLDDIERVRAAIRNRPQRAGRVRLWSADEKKDRTRRYRLLGYWSGREGTQARARTSELRKGLDEQARGRRRQLGLPVK